MNLGSSSDSIQLEKSEQFNTYMKHSSKISEKPISAREFPCDYCKKKPLTSRSTSQIAQKKTKKKNFDAIHLQRKEQENNITQYKTNAITASKLVTPDFHGMARFINLFVAIQNPDKVGHGQI